jgi:DNA-binding transcriptional ArsR family regulator
MALLDLNRFANLAEEERMDRIAALISKAVVLYRRDERLAGRPEAPDDLEADAPVRDVADLVTYEGEKQMLRYLARISSATPRNFRIALGLSRQTVARKLARLRAVGLVVVTDKTRVVRYELAGQSGNN